MLGRFLEQRIARLGGFTTDSVSLISAYIGLGGRARGASQVAAICASLLSPCRRVRVVGGADGSVSVGGLQTDDDTVTWSHRRVSCRAGARLYIIGMCKSAVIVHPRRHGAADLKVTLISPTVKLRTKSCRARASAVCCVRSARLQPALLVADDDVVVHEQDPLEAPRVRQRVLQRPDFVPATLHVFARHRGAGLAPGARAAGSGAPPWLRRCALRRYQWCARGGTEPNIYQYIMKKSPYYAK